MNILLIILGVIFVFVRDVYTVLVKYGFDSFSVIITFGLFKMLVCHYGKVKIVFL